MSNYTRDPFESSDSLETPLRPGQLSSNGHWVFGSIYAGLALVGFAFGVWAGAPPKSKSVEVADKQKDTEKTPARPAVPPPVTNPNPVPPPVAPEPKKDPEPEPKPKEPEPKPKEPEPKPKPKEVVPKPPERVVLFKEIEPVIKKYCHECHGALAGKQKGGIDLRTIAAIKKGGNNGDILTVGDPKKSTLYTSMLPTAGEKMPPDGKPQPSETDINLIRDWIASGAKPRRRTIRRRKLELTPGPEPE